MVRGTGIDIDRLERDMRQGMLQLLALAIIRRKGPIHGYGLIKEMESATGEGAWKEGTVYPMLSNLEKQGVLRSRWGTGPGARRKYYELTGAGTDSLRSAHTSWASLRDAVDAALEDP